MRDQNIILALKNGDTSVFKEVYKIYPMIRKMVISNSGREEDAKDVFQNALITLYENVKKDDFELSSKLSTYIFSICKNNWLKTLTRHETKKVSYNPEIDYRTEDEEIDEQLLSSDDLSRALSDLGEPCMGILIDFYFHKLNMEEIAEKYEHNSAKTSRQQKYKCLNRLKKIAFNYHYNVE